MAPVSNKKLLEIQATIDCRFTLKLLRDMIITYSYIHFSFKGFDHNLMLLICWKRMLFCPKSGKNGPKIVFFEFIKKFGLLFLLDMIYNRSLHKSHIWEKPGSWDMGQDALGQLDCRIFKSTIYLDYLNNEVMNWADFLHVDTNLGKLKVTIIIIGWAWSKIGAVV